MYNEIKSIKTVARAKKVWESLFASYTQRVGIKTAEHHDKMFRDYPGFAEGGLAWWKARCRSVAQNIVQAESVVNHFVPASPETEVWGGFLGGEQLVYTNESAKVDSEAMLAARIAGI